MTDERMTYLLGQYNKIKDHMWVRVCTDKKRRKLEEQEGWSCRYVLYTEKKPKDNQTWKRPTYGEFCNICENKPVKLTTGAYFEYEEQWCCGEQFPGRNIWHKVTV